jgi:energy-coupling factor transport system permease protein
MRGFLDYVHGESIPHRLNPLTKIIVSFGLCLAPFLTQSLALVAAIIFINLCFAAAAGLLNRSLAVLRSLARLSAVLFLVQIFFVREGAIILRLPLGLYVTDKGAAFSLLFVMRLAAATMPLTLMLSITRMSDISNVLVRRLRIPYKYAFVLTTAIRFIPLFSEEMTGVMEAQMARGVEFDTRNFFKKISLLLPLCAPLLISSVRRVEEGAISAELRGFSLRHRTSGYKRYPFEKIDAGALALCAMLIIAALACR